MLDWLKRIFGQSPIDKRQRLLDLLHSLNANAGGGAPTTVERQLGTLNIPSGVLAFGDPQNLPTIELRGINACEVFISGKLWQYPSGAATVIGLTIDLGNASQGDAPRKIGELGIDSATLVIADRVDIAQHWGEGKERIGVISTAPDDTWLRRLEKKFKLKTVQINRVRAEIVGPVSESLEQEIRDYLDSKLRGNGYRYFRLQTNDSFTRAISRDKPWDFIPVGNEDIPLMFVCGTGHGDGCYEVHCRYNGDAPQQVFIDFVRDDSHK